MKTWGFFVLLALFGCTFIHGLESLSTSSCQIVTPLNLDIAKNSTVESIKWINGANKRPSQVGLVLMTDGKVFRTIDGGKTLVPVVLVNSTTGLPTDESVTNIFATNDGSRVYLLTKSTWSWFSTDQGSTWNATNLFPLQLYDLQLHPTNSSRVIGVALTECCSKSLACSTCNSVLVSSQDGGQTWTTLASYVAFRGIVAGYSCRWGPNIGSDNTNKIFDSHISYIAYSDRTGDQRLKLGEALNLYILSDFTNASSIVNIIPDAGPYILSASPSNPSPTYYVARVSTGRPGLSSIMVGTESGANWSRALFPPVSSSDALRKWLEYNQGAPFLASFNGPDYSYGNLFVGNGGAKNFSLVLRGLAQRRSVPQFTHIGASIPGTYIANALKHVDDIAPQTFITHNHGATWDDIELDSRKKGSDNVQLVAPFDGAKFHSVASSPGTLLASGEIADKLVDDYTKENVLLSIDGGRKWKLVLPGSHILRAVNSGSILVAMQDYNLTNVVKYSINRGATWNHCEFSDSLHQGVRFWTSTDDSSLLLILETLKNGNETALYTLDFSSVLPANCTPSDYETWTLKDNDEHSCLLGKINVYQRVKSSSICRQNGDARLLVSSPCSCSKDDFTCSYCFYRNDDGECDYLWDYCPESQAPPSPLECKKTFVDPTNSAFVRIADSSCSGGTVIADLESELSCPPLPVVDNPPPPVSTLQGSFLVTAAAVSLALCGIVIVGCYYGCKSAWSKETIDFDAWMSRDAVIARNEPLNDDDTDTPEAGLNANPEPDLGGNFADNIETLDSQVELDEFN